MRKSVTCNRIKIIPVQGFKCLGITLLGLVLKCQVLVKHKSTNVRLHKNPFPYESLAEADSKESTSAVTFLSPMSRTSIAPKIVSCVLNACLHLCFQSRELRRHPRVGLLTCTQRSSSNDSLRLGYRFRVVSNPK